MFAKGEKFLLLIRHPLQFIHLYSLIQSSPVKVLAVKEERKNLRKKKFEIWIFRNGQLDRDTDL